MAIISPTINLVARPNGVFPPDLFEFSNSLPVNGTYSIDPVNRMIKNTAGYPREDYDITTGDFTGYLIEAASTNLIGSRGRQLTTANGWGTIVNGTLATYSGVGFTDPDIASPSGNTCTYIAPNSGQTATVTLNLSEVTITGGLKYSVSIFARLYAGTGATVGLSLNGTNWTSSAITSSNWVRIYCGPVPASTSTLNLTVKVTSTSGISSVYLDYLQVEQGNVTSPISVSKGSRGVDTLTEVSPSPLGQKINPNKGTFYTYFCLTDNSLKIPKAKYGILNVSNSLNSAKVMYAVVNSDSSPTDTALLVLAPGLTSALLFAITSLDSAVKVAVTYERLANPKIAINGVVNNTSNAPGVLLGDASSYLPTLSIGKIPSLSAQTLSLSGKTYTISASTDVGMDGCLKHFAYFPAALSDDDLISLTTL